MDFLNALDARVRNLTAQGKQVFLTGDINISKCPIDSAHALEGIRKCATTKEEFLSSPPRKLFNELLDDGEVVGTRETGREKPVLHDICRTFHPARPGMYTCWDTRLNTRPGNYGSRIDYVLCSLGMRDWFTNSHGDWRSWASNRRTLCRRQGDATAVMPGQVHRSCSLQFVEMF